MTNSSPKLVTDTRGAILILGIAMGTLLVGALWQVASIGDAIIWREAAQDAADAAAFENAVWNARGMNVIVIMNIVMSVLMFLVLLWRVVMMFLGLLAGLAIIACATSWIPAGINQLICASGSYTGPAFRWMLSNDQRFTSAIHRILLAINKAEKVVATATPAIGVVTAADATKNAHRVSMVIPFSASLTPTIDHIARFRGPSDSEGAARYRGALQPRMGWGISLPVQEDRYAVLCERAAELLPSQIEGGLRRSGAPSMVVELWSRIGNVAGAIAGSVPGLFCMPQATSIPSEIGDAVRRTANQRCEEEREHTRRTENGRDVWPDPDHPDDQSRSVPRFDMGRCRQRVSDDRENPLSQMPNARQPQDAKPAKVWDYARNGNLFMQSWAVVNKPKTMLDRDDEGLEIADQNRTGSLVEMDEDGLLDGLTWAQAEMFYDCGGVWDQETCRTDAMWAIRWKARLRRIQDIRSMAGQAAAGIVLESIVSGLYRVMGDLTERYTQRGLALPDILNMNLRDVWYTNEYIRTAARRWAYGTSGYQAGERLLRGDPSRRTLIH